MKKFNRLFVILPLCLIFISACKKDKADPNVLRLEGQWKYEKLNFLDESVKWDPNIPLNGGTGFGYAPYMLAEMQGMYFGTTKVEGDLGNLFNFTSEGEHNQDPAKIYWYWNYTDEKKGFEINQINPANPPYNFSIMDITDIRISNKGEHLVFKAAINSRKVGGAMKDVSKVPVEITISKGTPTTEVALLLNGAPLELP